MKDKLRHFLIAAVIILFCVWNGNAQQQSGVNKYQLGITYNADDLVSNDGDIYKALSQNSTTPPSADWSNIVGTKTSDFTNDGDDGVNPFISLADLPPSLNPDALNYSVLWTSDLLFNCTADKYYIVNAYYSASATTITLDAADVTNPRIDLIVANTSGLITKITGTAAPSPLEPNYDLATEFPLKFILVNANSTTPDGISNNLVYDENTGSAGGEWTGVTTLSGNPNSGVVGDYASTDQAYSGTKSTKLRSGLKDYASWSNSTGVLLDEITAITFWIKFPSDMSNEGLQLIGLLSPDEIVSGTNPWRWTVINNSNGIDLTSSSWQQLTIPLQTYKNIAENSYGTNFTMKSLSIIIESINSGINIYVDKVEVQTDGSAPPVVPISENNLHTVGNESFTGIKSSTNTGATQINGLSFINNGTAAQVVKIENISTGYGLYTNNTSSGRGIYSDNTSNGKGIYIGNSGVGDGIFVANESNGLGIRIVNNSSGTSFLSNAGPSGTGYNFVGQNNGVNTFTVDKLGNVVANNFSGSSSGTNQGDQTITNTSDGTSHTATLSDSGGSLKLVEGSGVTITTTGTGLDGIATIAATGGGGGGDVSKVGTPVNQQIGYWTGDGTLAGDTALNWDGNFFNLGRNDAEIGNLRIYGGAGSNGGRAIFYSGAADDSFAETYTISAGDKGFFLQEESSLKILDFSSVDGDITILETAKINVFETTSSTLDLSSTAGNLVSMTSANSATTYTYTGAVPNGYSQIRINAASEPTVTAATKTNGADFIVSTDMYLVVWHNGFAAQYYFLEI